MQVLLAAVAALTFFFFPGFQLAAYLLKESSQPMAHLLSLSMLLSVAINSLSIYCLGLLGAISSQNAILLIIVSNCVGAFIFRKSVWRVFRGSRYGFSIHLVALGFIAFIWSALLINGATWPFAQWDALATFNPVAKKIISTGSTVRFLLPGYLPSFQIWYPIGFPTSYAWAYLVSGIRTENVAHMMAPFFFLILVGYSYLLAKELGGIGSLAALLVTVTPPVLYYALSGYADVAAASFFVATAYYGTRWVTSNSKHDALLSGLAAGMIAWMKPQGLLIVVAVPALLTLLWVMRGHGLYSLRTRSLVILLMAEAIPLVTYFYTILAFGFSPIAGPATRLLEGTRALSYAQGSLLSNAGNRFGTALTTLFLGETVPQNQMLVIVAIVGLFGILVTSVRFRALFSFMLTLTYFVGWSVTQSWADRHLVSFLAIAMTLSSVWVVKVVAHRKARTRILAAIILAAILIGPAWNATAFAIRGYGPDLLWSFSHVETSVDEKSNMTLGELWRIAEYATSHSEIANARLLVTDSRMLDWLVNATYTPSIPKDPASRCHFDYVIGTSAQFAAVSNTLQLVHQEGNWQIYRVICTS